MLDTQKYENDEIVRFEVQAKNHTFLIDCNRPALVKKKLAHHCLGVEFGGGEVPGLVLCGAAAGDKAHDQLDRSTLSNIYYIFLILVVWSRWNSHPFY